MEIFAGILFGFFMCSFLILTPIRVIRGYLEVLKRNRSYDYVLSILSICERISNNESITYKEMSDSLYGDDDTSDSYILFNCLIYHGTRKKHHMSYEQYSEIFERLRNTYDKSYIRSRNIDKVLEGDLE